MAGVWLLVYRKFGILALSTRATGSLLSYRDVFHLQSPRISKVGEARSLYRIIVDHNARWLVKTGQSEEAAVVMGIM